MCSEMCVIACLMPVKHQIHSCSASAHLRVDSMLSLLPTQTICVFSLGVIALPTPTPMMILSLFMLGCTTSNLLTLASGDVSFL